MSSSELLTSTQAGVILGKSGRTVQRMADAGTLPFAGKLPGPNGAYLFDRATVERVAAENAADDDADQLPLEARAS